MRILLSNDDGVEATGLMVLRDALASIAEVWVVAPDSERSAQSHALTLHKPLRVKKLEERRFSVSGTPADCVYTALHHVLPAPPDLVVSGINRGANLGNDVWYSGTVAAAREATLHGAPAIAISLVLDDESAPRWHVVPDLARRIVSAAAAHGIAPGVLWNVNVPNRDHVVGIRTARLGARRYEITVDERLDLRGKPYVWIGGPPCADPGAPGTDVALVATGYASITPIHVDATSTRALEELHGIFDP